MRLSLGRVGGSKAKSRANIFGQSLKGSKPLFHITITMKFDVRFLFQSIPILVVKNHIFYHSLIENSVSHRASTQQQCSHSNSILHHNLKKQLLVQPLLGSVTVCLPISTIKVVGDLISLKESIEDLKYMPEFKIQD